jgi:hypothetical protein
MNFKTTYLLFAMLGVLLLAVGLMRWLGPSPVDPAYIMDDLQKAKVKADDIDYVEIVRSSGKPEKLVFVRDKEKNRWKATVPAEYRVEFSPVSTLVHQVVSARKVEATDIDNNLERWGLAPPQMVVTLKKGGADGQEFKLNIGKEGFKKEQVYVTSSGSPKTVKAVKRISIENVFKPLNEFRTKELMVQGVVNLPEMSEELTLSGPGGKKLVLTKVKRDSLTSWKFVEPPYGDAEEGGQDMPGDKREEMHLSGVRGLLNAISGLSVETESDFVADSVPDADLAKYGLTAKDPATLKIELKRQPSDQFSSKPDAKDLVTETLLIGKPVPPAKEDKKDDKADKKAEKADEKKEEKKEEKYYARLASENHVVQVPARGLQLLLKALNDPALLRNRDLLASDLKKADAIDLASAGSKDPIQLRHVGDPPTWKMVEGKKTIDADRTTVENLLNALTVKGQVREFPTKDDKELGLDKPAAVVSLWLGGIKRPDADEKKDDKKDDKKDAKKEEKKPSDAPPELKDPSKPTVKLTFGKTDGDLVFVKREIGGETAKLAVARKLLDDVSKGRLAYLERRLPELASDQVTEITLAREGKPTLVLFKVEDKNKDKDKDKDGKMTKTTWKVREPDELKDRLADPMKVDEILNDLRFLTPDEFVAEKPSDTQLARYGLNKPLVEIRLTLGDPKDKKSRAYLFGKPVDEKLPDGKIYARLSDSDLVFTVPARLAKRLADEELADPRIFAFDAAKVKELKLTIALKKVGLTVGFVFERSSDGKSWKVIKAPDSFNKADLDDAKINSFLTSLSNLSAVKFVSFKKGPLPTQELDEKQRSLFAEAVMDDGKTVHALTVGKLSDEKEKKSYYAQSNALPGDVFLVAEELFGKLLEEGAKYFTK